MPTICYSILQYLLILHYYNISVFLIKHSLLEAQSTQIQCIILTLTEWKNMPHGLISSRINKIIIIVIINVIIIVIIIKYNI